MTQTTILPPGNTPATSSTFTVGAFDSVKVGIYSDDEDAILPVNYFFVIEEVTPGLPNIVGYLTSASRSVSINAPGTYHVRLSHAYEGTPFGVFTDKA